eukprot:13718-Eustigmatos_ZCMA.PRE.1
MEGGCCDADELVTESRGVARRGGAVCVLATTPTPLHTLSASSFAGCCDVGGERGDATGRPSASTA